MKKSFLMAALAISVSFVACKKDKEDDKPKTTNEKIVGKWKGDQGTVVITAPPPIGSQTQNEDLRHLNVEFKSNGTAVIDSAGFDAETSSWSLVGDNKIILDSDTFDIKVLNDTQFHFGFEETDDFGGIPVSISTTIKLKK
jgi:hypothetical protein